MSKFKNLFGFVIFNLIISFVTSSTLCDEVSEIPKGRLATKTGYFNALKDESHWEEYRKETVECTPVKVWFLTRHGTRYPIPSDIRSFEKLPQLSEEILYNHLQGRGCLSEEDVFEFKDWIRPYEPRDKGQLHTIGSDELYSMGEYWRDLFPEIFGESYDSAEVKVEFTVRNRTGQSAYHFLRGMYGDEAIGKIPLPKPYEPNFVLRFYKSCPRWLREVYRNNETTYRERNLFQLTGEFEDTVRAISSRLGYLDPLNLDDLTIMYDECRYETAWFPDQKSIWCKPFSQKDIKVLEYHQDLKYYYEDSYGTPINKDMACQTLSDLYTHLKKKVTSSVSLPNGVLYFSHDKAIMKIQALLGLFKPTEHLKHDNFSHKDRKFRSSYVSPFASNLGFVLYRCGESHKVGMFFEGNPLPVTSVCPAVLCDWERYEEFFHPIYENCDLSKICQIHDEL